MAKRKNKLAFVGDLKPATLIKERTLGKGIVINQVDKDTTCIFFEHEGNPSNYGNKMVVIEYGFLFNRHIQRCSWDSKFEFDVYCEGEQ